jgi:hypothetical protein
MTRKTLIAIVLCTALLMTFGVGVVTAASLKLPPPYRGVQFDVIYKNDAVGKLSLNTNQWTYVMNAHGLEPGTSYFFYSLGRFPAVGTGTANENGDLHMQGAWDPQTADITLSPEFVLTKMPLTGTGCVPTQLTAWQYKGIFWAKCWGELTTSDGSPIPDQPLVIEEEYYDDLGETIGYRFFKGTNTLADGTFELGCAEAWGDPKVIYEGGVRDGTTYCSSWAIFTVLKKLPL